MLHPGKHTHAAMREGRVTKWLAKGLIAHLPRSCNVKLCLDPQSCFIPVLTHYTIISCVTFAPLKHHKTKFVFAHWCTDIGDAYKLVGVRPTAHFPSSSQSSTHTYFIRPIYSALPYPWNTFFLLQQSQYGQLKKDTNFSACWVGNHILASY